MMNKFFRMIFIGLSMGMIIFLSGTNLTTYAQEKDSCKTDNEGWRPVAVQDIKLTGKWNWVASTNCRDNWGWAGVINISHEKDKYTTFFDAEIEVQISGTGVIFHRDVSTSAGKDKNSLYLQTWIGKFEMHEDGRVRIYGRWTGAFDYLVPEGFNKDFKMIRQ